ncbi:MAG: hypothetical protein A2735_00045 [Candidatus Yanofskybacteria bacterium RIFCSPHIGHO2_01_FULL_41_21]|uniref:Addiction module toxin, HicA family n=1 Tax=Candidatus Yanofskybacteria bacterium RIFCSPHIGHO2_01_FULL_41_21 TaxID=1802660 RepID=A0A1F8EBH6_9BACT|nr:MAG: hypothetical protein A2735_00045 [Candidatus Yanofskybacteria bacterium RIFCSPHIGHO2_01_FULL_41_21]
MSIVPMVKPKELIKVLLKAGFKIIRQTGSHVRLERQFDRSIRVTVPIHNNDLPRRLLMDILKQAGLTVEKLKELL